MNIGDKIRSLREDKDITRQQMADLIPMNLSNYSKIERNQQQPSIEQLTRIVEILGITLDSLLGIDENSYVENYLKQLDSNILKAHEKNLKK